MDYEVLTFQILLGLDLIFSSLLDHTTKVLHLPPKLIQLLLHTCLLLRMGFNVMKVSGKCGSMQQLNKLVSNSPLRLPRRVSTFCRRADDSSFTWELSTRSFSISSLVEYYLPTIRTKACRQQEGNEGKRHTREIEASLRRQGSHSLSSCST